MRLFLANCRLRWREWRARDDEGLNVLAAIVRLR